MTTNKLNDAYMNNAIIFGNNVHTKNKVDISMVPSLELLPYRKKTNQKLQNIPLLFTLQDSFTEIEGSLTYCTYSCP